jgi:hypothetical protein
MNQSDPYGVQNTTVSEDTQRVLQLATAQSAMLRRAFRHSVLRGGNSSEWSKAEDSVAAFLAQHAEAGLDGKEAWFDAANRAVRRRMSVLLARKAPQSDRYRQFLGAAENLSGNARAWSGVLSGAEAAYWKHAALVWTALWHAVDSQNVTPAEANACLAEAFKVEADTEANSRTGKRGWFQASGRFAASLLKRA